MSDEIKEILDFKENADYKKLSVDEITILRDYITNLQEVGINKYQTLKDLEQENEKLKREVAKLHIIQEEYGSHIENTHIIDDYQKTYFMSNKYLIELKNGKFVDINVLNDEYEDYKSRCEKGLDKLYCYGEVFDSKILQEFQKEMINTLTGGDKE